MPEDTRAVALKNLSNQPGIRGTAARDIAAQYGQLDTSPPVVQELLDKRVEKAQPPKKLRKSDPTMGKGFINLFTRANANINDVLDAYSYMHGGTNSADTAQKISENARKRAEAAPSQDIQDGMMAIGSAEGFGDVSLEMVKNPGATLSMLADSLMVSLPLMVPAIASKSKLAVGASSFALEYGSAMTDVLNENGVDLLNAEAVAKALSDPKIMDKIKDQGIKRGIPIAVIDGLAMGFAGRFLKPARDLIAAGKLTGAAAKRATVVAWSKELAAQSVAGMSGETIAQQAAGQRTKYADIMLEGLGEAALSPLEIASNLRGSAELERQAASGNLPPEVPGERIDPTLGPNPNAPISPTTPTEEPPASPSGAITEPTGASVPVVSEPGAAGPAEGVAGVESSGVVPSAEDAGGAAAGKGTVPTAVASFKTSKGSNYAVFEDGTTQRNKSPHPEHPGDVGLKERTVRTVYVDGDASRLSAAGVENMEGARVILGPDGTASLVWKNPKTGKLGSSKLSSKIPVYNEPAVGRYPLELWQPRNDVPGYEAFAGMHAGNKITEITPATPTTTEETASGTETPEAQQTEAQGQATPAVSPTATPASLDPLKGDGWKIHLNVPSAAAKKAISKYLSSIGYGNSRTTATTGQHKVGKNSGQSGKDITVYTGDRATLEKIAADIEAKFGNVLQDHTEGLDSYTDDVSVNGSSKVYARFDTPSDKTMAQYGGKGKGHIADLTPNYRYERNKTEKEKKRAEVDAATEQYLTNKYGEGYTGKAAKQAAPQEASVNEDEVRASAVPLPGGRVEPYLSRNPLVARTEEELADDEELGDPVQAAEDLKQAGISVFEKIRKSRLGEEGPIIAEGIQARDPKKVMSILRRLMRRGWNGMPDSVVEAIVAQPTFTFLADWSGINAIKDAALLVQEMNGYSQELLAEAHEVYKEIAKELNPLLFKREAYRKKFEDMVLASTLARYDPSDPASTPLEGRNSVQVEDARKIDAMYKSIGPKGQEMYKNLKEHYEKMVQLYSDLLDAQINQIPGMSSEAKANLITLLRKTFEAESRIRPFFPLVRYGDYFMRVQEMKGTELLPQFYMFESKNDLLDAQQRMVEDNPNAIIEIDKGVSQLRLKSYKARGMLTSMFDAIDAIDFGAEQNVGAVKDSLKDAVYQFYLTTMPEQSFRSQFIHRKDITGFSPDLLRNIATSASRSSMQLAKLKYAPMLRNSLSGARDAIKGRIHMVPFVAEAEKRVNMALAGDSNDKLDVLAGLANKISYYWMLTGAASAIIQPVQIALTGLPTLAGNYNNITGAIKELSKMFVPIGKHSQIGMTKVDRKGNVSLGIPSIANNPSFNSREKDAIKQMIARGVTQSTQATLLYGHKDIRINSSSTSLGKLGNLGKEAHTLATSSLIHNLERLSRELLYAPAYRLGYSEGLKKKMTSQEAHEYAINKAVVSVNEALGNYDMGNRPRWTQKGVGRVAFQFKMFPLHTTLFLLTNFVRMMPFLNAEGKKAAATKFMGTYLTVGVLAGYANIPFFSSTAGVLLGMAAAALKKAEEEDDDPQELKDLDPVFWFREVYVPQIAGEVSISGVPISQILEDGVIDYITGKSVSSRIGMNDMWGRDTREAKTGREAMKNFMSEHSPPILGAVAIGMDTYDSYLEGDYGAMVKGLPAYMRNPAQAYQEAQTGVRGAKDKVIIRPEDVDTGTTIARSIGFQTSSAAKSKATGNKAQSAIVEVDNKENLLKARLKVQARKLSPEGWARFSEICQEEVPMFNHAFPERELTPKAIYDMTIADLQSREEAQLGVDLAAYEKNYRIVGDVINNMNARLYRENKARQAAKEK